MLQLVLCHGLCYTVVAHTGLGRTRCPFEPINFPILPGLVLDPPPNQSISIIFQGSVSLIKCDPFLRLDTATYGHHLSSYCPCLRVEVPPLFALLISTVHGPSRGISPALFIPPQVMILPTNLRKIVPQGRRCLGSVESCNFLIKQASSMSDSALYPQFIMLNNV